MNRPYVEQFRETLLWPMALKLPYKFRKQPIHKTDEWLTALAHFLQCSAWKPTELFDWNKASDSDTRYAEFVYFHPFVQRFLYGLQGNYNDSQQPSIQLYQRNDISGLEFLLEKRSWYEPDEIIESIKARFKVERLFLYVFDIGLVIISVDLLFEECFLLKKTGIEREEKLSVKHVQDILDSLRRIYPPYWDCKTSKKNDKKYISAGHCPTEVRWLGNLNEKTGCKNYSPVSNFNEPDCHKNHVSRHHTTPVASHWRYLLAPLDLYSNTGQHTDGFLVKQLGDERLPFLAYLALDKPEDLTRGDFVRLCFGDESGNFVSTPYAPSFLEKFEHEYCYDRYWNNEFNIIYDWMNTRYMNCGYGFVLVGKNDNGGFFTDAKIGAVAHFRHHYYLMGLIAHFHKYALLMISDQLSEVAYDVSKTGTADEVQRIHQRLLRFTHRFWFPELTNQIQGRELFSMWSRHLGTSTLFSQVKIEAQEINQYLDGVVQNQQAETSVRLTVVATIALTFTLIVGALGMNLFDNESEVLMYWIFGAFLSSFLLIFYTLRKARYFEMFFNDLSKNKPIFISIKQLFSHVKYKKNNNN